MRFYSVYGWLAEIGAEFKESLSYLNVSETAN